MDLSCRHSATSPDTADAGNSAVSAVIDRQRLVLASSNAFERPVLITTVDAEESFEWSNPLSRASTSVTAMHSQHRAHAIFARYGVVPVYLVDYPVATQDAGRSPLRELLADGSCEIGAQLHPWVTPPHLETVSVRNSFSGNLPAELEREKLRVLTHTIQDFFEVAPRVYRAGRYGFGPHTAKHLKALGYKADMSVVPLWSFATEGGPDYRLMPAAPFWLDTDRKLLELPISAALVGLASRLGWVGLPHLFDAGMDAARLPAVLARLKLLERIKLTPEGITIGEAKRLVRHMVAHGTRVFILTYHSPSLEPGNTPYVRTVDDLQRFLAWLDEFYEFFGSEIRGTFLSWSEVYRTFASNAAAPADQTKCPLWPPVRSTDCITSATPAILSPRATSGHAPVPGPEQTEDKSGSNTLSVRPRLLVFAFYYPPENVSGAARPHRMARYLVERGYEVKVISANPGGLETSPPGVIRVPSNTTVSAKAQTWADLIKMGEQLLWPYDDRLRWVPHALAAGADCLEPGTDQIVFSTHPPVATHIAALLLKRRYNLHWIADFRDPLRGNPFRTTRRGAIIDPLLERLIFTNADAVIANTDAAANVWRQRYPQWAGKIHVIWNGFDPAEQIVPLPPVPRERRFIVHVGTLYGPRTADIIAQSLSRLVNSATVVANSFQLRLIGPVQNACLAHPAIDHLTSVGSLYVNNCMVPKVHAQREMLEADYLLLLDITGNRNSGLQVPAKIFEYIRACRPIIAFTAPGSATEQVLEQSGVRYICIDPGAAPEKVDAKVANFLAEPPNETRPSQEFWQNFDARRQVDELISIIAHL